MGFLWFNSFPAAIFMGDTGSLGLGGAIAALAVMTKTEVLLLIIGGIFVIEALSVLIQVFAFQRFRRRVFLMAPIHHHFEMLGLVGDQDHPALLDRRRDLLRRSASRCTSSRSHDAAAAAAAGPLPGGGSGAVGPGRRADAAPSTAR